MKELADILNTDELHEKVTNMFLTHLIYLEDCEKQSKDKPEKIDYASRCATRCIQIIQEHCEKLK